VTDGEHKYISTKLFIYQKNGDSFLPIFTQKIGQMLKNNVAIEKTIGIIKK
jgi:hypothetical protein